jgi:hypothetical protein
LFPDSPDEAVVLSALAMVLRQNSTACEVNGR